MTYSKRFQKYYFKNINNYSKNVKCILKFDEDKLMVLDLQFRGVSYRTYIKNCNFLVYRKLQY